MRKHKVSAQGTISKQNQNGFTLIELLLVIALMAIAVGVTSDILVTLIRSYNKSQVLTEIEQNTNFIAQKMDKEFRNAVLITALGTYDNPTTGNASNEITFTTKDKKEITYKVDNNVISRQVDGGTDARLTSTDSPGGVVANCIVANACFKLISVDPQVLQIGILFTQAGTSTNKVFQGDIKLEDTIVVRDTY